MDGRDRGAREWSAPDGVAIGFAEREERDDGGALRPIAVWLRTDPTAVPQPANEDEVQMQRGSHREAIRLTALVEWLRECGADEQARALTRLAKLAE